jgi:hypothetical protein
VAILAGLTVLITAGAATFVLLRPDGGTPAKAASTPAAAPSHPAFQRVSGPAGARLTVPYGWSRHSLSTTSVRWTERSTGAYVQVDAGAEAGRNLVKLVGQAKVSPPDVTVLKRASRRSAQGWRLTDFEVTWAAGTHRVHGYERLFDTNKRVYAILVSATAGQWSRYAGLTGKIFKSFQPGAMLVGASAD